MPCLGEGRGHRVRQRQRGREGERGGRNGLQDKPTFLKTPGVVTTGAKQLKPSHCGYLAHEIRVSTTLLKSMTMINMILSIGRWRCHDGSWLKLKKKILHRLWLVAIFYGYLAEISLISEPLSQQTSFINEVNSTEQRACHCQIYVCYSNSPAINRLSPLVLVTDTSLCFVATSADRKLTLREWPSGWYIGEDSWAHL